MWVALVDMHHCDSKMDAKRLKGTQGKRCVRETDEYYHRLENHPISAYRLFMESFSRVCKMKNYLEIERAGFEKWKNMSEQEKQPYVCHAKILEYNQEEALNREAKAIKRVRDKADSTMVGKFDKDSQSNLIYKESSDLVSDSKSKKDGDDIESSSSSI